MAKYVKIILPVTSGDKYFLPNQIFCYLGEVTKNKGTCACQGKALFYQIRIDGKNYDIISTSASIIEQEECDPEVMPLQERLPKLGDVPYGTTGDGVKITEWQATRQNNNPDAIAQQANITYF